MSRKIKIIVVAVTFLLLIGGSIFVIPKAELQTGYQPALQDEPKMPKASSPEPVASEPVVKKSSELLPVPFICQAPLQTEENWKFHEESCEEAAVLQAYLYETGQVMTKQQANEEILKMVNWQMQNFGEHKDLYADDVKKFISGYYNIPVADIEVTHDTTLDNIKDFILQGYPVIVPIMGNILKNPYYPYPGYHMLTVIGFTEDKIITNDNGTRHGEKFSYNNEIFLEAMAAAGGDIVVIKTKTTSF